MHEAQIRAQNDEGYSTAHQNCRSRYQWRTDCLLCREALYQIWYDSLANERSVPSPAGGSIEASAAFDALSIAIAMVEDASKRGDLLAAMR